MTIHLVRHASAGVRGHGPDDRQRPLDERGRDQAARVANVLQPFRSERLLSSPAARCTQTLAPLAERLGARIEILEDLWEGHGPHPIVAMITRLTAAGSSAVLCSHGDIIPAVLDELAASGVPMAGAGCEKGSIWELRVDDGHVVEGRYLG